MVSVVAAIIALAAAPPSVSTCDRRLPSDTSSRVAQQVLLPYFANLNERCKRYEAQEATNRRLHYVFAYGGLLIGTLGGLTGLFLRGESTQRKVAQGASLLTGLASGILGIAQFDAVAQRYHQCVASAARAQDRTIAEYASFTTITLADTARVTEFRKALEADIQNKCAEP